VSNHLTYLLLSLANQLLQIISKDIHCSKCGGTGSYPKGTGGSNPADKAAGAWRWPFISISCRG